MKKTEAVKIVRELYKKLVAADGVSVFEIEEVPLVAIDQKYGERLTGWVDVIVKVRYHER